MNVMTERLDTQEALLTVTVDAEKVEEAKRAAAKRISREINIPGFRKGKAPYARILQLVGEGALLEEALEDIGERIYLDALNESGLEPYAPGSLEKMETDPALVLTFKVPLRPEVDLGAYRDVRVPFEKPEIADDEVNAAIEALRDRQAVVEPVERAAGWGDEVTLDIFGELLPPGQEAPDPEAEVAPEDLFIDEEAFQFVIDRERDLVPGFSEQLVGMAAGDQKTFVLSIPDDDENKTLAGRRVAFEVECVRVSSRTLPALTDAFAAEVTDGEFETLLDLRIEVRRQLQERVNRRAEEPYFEAVMDKVLEGATLAYPPVMIDEYADAMLEDLDRNLRTQRGITLDDYLRISKQTREQLREQQREAAERRLRRALVLGKVVDVEQLEPSDEDLDAEIEKLLDKAGDQAAGVLRESFKNEETRRVFRLDLMTQRAVERLIAIAKGENPPIGPTPEPALGKKVHSEHVATLDDLRDQVEAMRERAEAEERKGKLFPGERVEGGIVRID